MRKDVKLGFTIGGILLAVLIVYVLVVPEKEQSQVNLIGEDGNPILAESLPANPVVPPAESVITDTPEVVAEAPTQEPLVAPAEVIEAEVATATPSGADVNWESLLGGGDVLMTRTPVPTEAPSVEFAIEPKPVIDSSSIRTADVAPANEAVTPTTRPTVGGPRTHVVQNGETLSSISKAAYGSANYYPHIIRANPDVNPNRLKVGTTLLLPDVADVVPTAAGASSTTAAPVDSKSEYRVQSRDSLYSISVKLYGSPEKMAELYELNKQAIGADPGKLKLNMVLKLPAAPTASASR